MPALENHKGFETITQSLCDFLLLSLGFLKLNFRFLNFSFIFLKFNFINTGLMIIFLEKCVLF